MQPIAARVFKLDAKEPNVIAGAKRQYQTIIPAFMERGGSAYWLRHHAAARISSLAHAQFVSNLVDYGMNIQAALEAPRFTKRTCKRMRRDDSNRARPGGHAAKGYSEYGHQIDIRREYTQVMGRRQAILHDAKTGVNYAASDPRADGAAIPEPIR